MTGADAISVLLAAAVAVYVARTILRRIFTVEREMERLRRAASSDRIRIAALGEQVELLCSAQRRRPPRVDCQGERPPLVIIEGGKKP